MDWLYVSANGERLAASEAELAGLAQNGVLKTTTLVWRQGQSDWLSAAEVLPGLFASTPRETAGLNVGRVALEPLWQRRGWLLLLVLGLLGVALLRAGAAAVEAWGDWPKLAGVAVSLLISLVVAGFLVAWWRALREAARAGGLHEARAASRAGGRVLVVCGLLGALLLVLTLYDLISLIARLAVAG